MKINIKLKTEDWMCFQKHLQNKIQKTIKNRFSGFLFNIVLWAFIAFMFLFIFNEYSKFHMQTAITIAIFIVSIVALYIYSSRTLYAAYSPSEKGILLGEHTYLINDIGIQSSGNGYSSLHKWSIIKEITRTPESILVFLDTSYAFIFPMRELENPEEFYKEITEINEKYNKTVRCNHNEKRKTRT